MRGVAVVVVSAFWRAAQRMQVLAATSAGPQTPRCNKNEGDVTVPEFASAAMECAREAAWSALLLRWCSYGATAKSS